MAGKPTAKQNIAGRVREAVAPLVEQAGYTLWDVTFGKEAAEWVLEITIDREGGIGTEDCAVVTKLVDPLLDEMDPIEGSYCLTVSSAGLERELREERHFAYALERKLPVVLRTFVAVDGARQFEGTLAGFDGEGVTLLTDGAEKRFSYKQIAKTVALCDGNEQDTERMEQS